MSKDSTFYRRRGKRLFDVLASAVAIILLGPVVALMAVLVRVFLGSPVLFRQVRSGRGKAPFTILKFRTMTDERDAAGKLLPDTLRLTAFGKFLVVTSAFFAGSFNSYVPVTLTSDRSGIIMETKAKVKMRGVQVGRVSEVGTSKDGARLTLEIIPDQIRYIPANVEAKVDVTTAFGAKFVDLVYPEKPSKDRLAAGAVLHSTNVSTEVNTVFENVVVPA